MDEIKYLNTISSPSDIRNYSDEQLNELCSEIRQVMIDTVSKNGGHLASNLGAVELTIAIHKCFDSPKDKIVWDVGHQIYTHKLLTGRYSQFSTLRQKDGISGFSRPDESEHDTFYSGHSSVSISSAYGIASANKIKGIRAACCSDVFSARFTRLHNDANVLCFGERVVGAGLANELVDAFLAAPFEGGRHQVRVDKIKALEE